MGLILASGSPRRRDLLQTSGIVLKAIRTSDIEELRQAEEAPEVYCRRLAREKAEAVAKLLKAEGESSDWVLAADTIVALGADIFEKPADDLDAYTMLRKLSTDWHLVLSAWHLLKVDGTKRESGVCHSEVRFRPLSDREIHCYISTGEGRDKAGSYGIQGLGAALIEEIRGSYSNIVGLPLHDVVTAIRSNNAES